MTTTYYPAKITSYLDGEYVECKLCGHKEARLSMSKAMEIALAHNEGRHDESTSS